MANLTKKKSTKVRDTFGDRALQAFTTIFQILVLFIIGYPLIFCISSSFSSPTALQNGHVWLWPVEFSLGGYEFILHYKAIWLGYRNTIFYTVTQVSLTLICIVLMAYPLSRPYYQAKSFVQKVMLVAMLTGAGLVPSFLMRVWFRMNNTIWAIILSGLTPINHIFIMRTSFKTSVPGELLDAAKIDGASDFMCLTKIAVPLAKATVSVLILYNAVGMWNSYFSAMIYLSANSDLWPLQLVLRNILISSAGLDAANENMSSSAQDAYAKSSIEQVRYAVIIVSTVPCLIMYLVTQKFFEKGVMVGSVKG